MFLFLLVVAFLLFSFIWLRATLPGLRCDGLMRFGCQVLLPLAVLNIIITATVVALGWPWWVSGLAGLIVIGALLLLMRRQTIAAQTPVAARVKGAMALPSSVRLAKFEKTQAVGAKE